MRGAPAGAICCCAAGRQLLPAGEVMTVAVQYREQDVAADGQLALASRARENEWLSRPAVAGFTPEVWSLAAPESKRGKKKLPTRRALVGMEGCAARTVVTQRTLFHVRAREFLFSLN